jgi:predicted DNA-binding WGR domain protein
MLHLHNGCNANAAMQQLHRCRALRTSPSRRPCREWGRLGKLRVNHHPDEDRAVDALADLVDVKRKRGYQ